MLTPAEGFPAASFTCTTNGTLRNCSLTTCPFPDAIEMLWPNASGARKKAGRKIAKITFFIVRIHD